MFVVTIVYPVGGLLDTILALVPNESIRAGADAILARPIVLAIHLSTKIILAAITSKTGLARALTTTASPSVEAPDIETSIWGLLALWSTEAIHAHAFPSIALAAILARELLAVIFLAFRTVEARQTHTLTTPADAAISAIDFIAWVRWGLAGRARKPIDALALARDALASINTWQHSAYIEVASGSREAWWTFALAFFAKPSVLAMDIGTWV